MKTITSAKAGNNINKLIDETSFEGKPIKITGKSVNAVLISEDDWNSIQETLYLLSIPGMLESLISGRKEPLEKCSDKLKW
ncbi:MAG: type II toxin-antitoxin system Phd/YefM family antitoxin [Ignavibacteria bacterium]|nr:type II toxin-antitoxin system Phd/YefM family antitoxin [Ignavibacteria bacterium]